MKTCQRCGQKVEWFRGQWWSQDDDFMCPDGEDFHEVQDGHQ